MNKYEVVCPEEFHTLREGEEVWGLPPGPLARLVLSGDKATLEAVERVTDLTSPLRWNKVMMHYSAVVIRRAA